MIIQCNMSAIYTNRQLGITKNNATKSMEKLESGYRINRASDDAAGLAISEKMRGQIRGLERSSKNLEDGMNFCNVADGALGETQDIINRIKELSVQAANDTNTDDDRAKINTEIKQLKKQIGDVSRNTEYNSMQILNKPYEVTFQGDIMAIGIFDATNGSAKDSNTYGGIIVEEHTRVAWNDIDSSMVYLDANGTTMFNAGVYTYDGGDYKLSISCTQGSKPPEISVEIPIKASGSGISIAGIDVPWSTVLDEENQPISDGIDEEGGVYHFPFRGNEISFSVPEEWALSDVINGINSYSDNVYKRKYVNTYDGYYEAQAVDVVDTGSQLRVSNAIYTSIINNQSIDYSMGASTAGIWINDMDGNLVPGSLKTWSDMGIDSWDSKDFVSDTKTYQYQFSDSNYDVTFNYSLLNETSVYSVIDGINNATVKPTSIQLSQTTSCNFTPGNGLVSGTLKSPVNNPLTISEEASLGRDFDQKIVEIGKEVLTYDSTSNQFSLVYEDASANPVLTYQSNSLTDVNAIKAKANDYLNYLTARQVQSLLSGSPVSTNTLTDVIGSSNITTSGYLSEVVTVDTATMKTSSNITNGTYPTAHIDFSQLGSSYQLYDLLGTGFNSTCKTCDAHYSVLFTYGGSESTTSNGYGYTMTNDGGENYTLQVDLKSFMDNGIANGVDFTNALVSVLDQSNFDFHYTQYESKNGILYVTDNREQTTGAPQATFDTKPYNIGTAQIDMTLKNSMDNRNLQMQFTYDVSQGMTATAQMLVAPLGNWVDDGSGGYKKFVYTDYYDSLGNLKSGIPSDPSRYTLQTTNNVSTWENYYDQVMTNIAAQSQVSITSDDYVYANCHTDENPNKAIVSTFDFKVVETKDFFWIQAGANTGDGIAMTWDRFNLYSLGLAGNVLSQKKASAMIEKADNASKIISQIRSTFGAYTNRMEHMYDIAQNTAENIQSAESGIRDTNMAKEMAELSKSNILEQAGQAMLAQANKSPQSVLQLLQF